MCVKLSLGDLNPTPHKHLYLWSDQRTKGSWWYYISIVSMLALLIKLHPRNLFSSKLTPL